MSARESWKVAYGRQRQLLGKALFVSHDVAITIALRRVMPPITRVQHSHMISGKAATCLLIYPPVESPWSQLCRVRKVQS